ncbi:MAG: CPBP family glutamic-type intramembrane protease [Cyanobacteria bacterium P01_A01_bin.84]
MTLKRIFLILLTLVAIASSGLDLYESLQKPQFQSRIELYQTDIQLQAASWKPDDSQADSNFQSLQKSLAGDKPFATATKQYESVRKSAKANLDKIETQLEKLSSENQTSTTVIQPQQEQLQKSLKELRELVAQIDLRLGILQAREGKTAVAIETWEDLQSIPQINSEYSETATVLTALWSNPPQVLDNAENLIKTDLEGWFRTTSLTQLYKLQQLSEPLTQVQKQAQKSAKQALLKLGIVVSLPGIAGITGVGLLIFAIAQRIVKGKNSLLAQNSDTSWTIPWEGETILQVFVLGFFLTGQIMIGKFVIPILGTILSPAISLTNVRVQALFVLISYLLVAAGTLAVLYFSIKPFLPEKPDVFNLKFKDKWFLWGFGGYCAALPIVLLVSALNQQLWQGQGGSNPLLQLVLNSHDSLALWIFFSTAAIAAPLFEELLFRGFLLPSLTRYIPTWGAVVLSSFIFAAVHLSLSEILPLTALGMILGFVYVRSRNLLAPMLLHSLWNSGTLMSLFILGSSTQ